MGIATSKKRMWPFQIYRIGNPPERRHACRLVASSLLAVLAARYRSRFCKDTNAGRRARIVDEPRVARLNGTIMK